MTSRVMSRLKAVRQEERPDEGFTLVEVIWAMFLLGIVAMGALMLFVNGMQTAADLQRKQVAASLAATALDNARSVTGGSVNVSNTSGLIKGRSASAVEAVWDEATAVDASATADMEQASDPAPGMTVDDQWVPVRTVQTVGNQQFTVDTLIGTCYRLATSSSVEQPCTRTRTTVNDAQMYRVRVIVSWDTGTQAGVDSYTVSTLVDPTEDATWNTALLPYAYDDEFTVIAGEAASFHAIVANDAVEITSRNPMVSAADQPEYGEYEIIDTTDSKNGILFTPPDDVSGTVSFTYRVQDAAGQVSALPANVVVHVLPAPVSDDLVVDAGSTTELNELILENDIGVENISAERRTAIVPFIDPTVDYFETEEVTPEITAAREADIAALEARGITVDGDGIVRFAAPTENDESRTFSYYLVDEGIGDDVALYPNRGGPATVTLTTAEPVTPAVDGEFTFDATAAQTFHELDWRSLATFDEEDRIRLVNASPEASSTHVRLDGTTGDAETLIDLLEFRTLPTNVGVHEYEYVVVSPGGRESAPAVLTVTVAPVAGDGAITVRRGSRSDLTLTNLGVPNTGVRVTAVGSTTCGTATIRPDGRVRFDAPSSNNWRDYPRTCTFAYRVATTGNPAIDSQDPATITVRVDW